MADQSFSLPLLYIKGRTSYSVGFQIGNTFKSFLQKHNRTETAAILRAFYESEKGKELYTESLALSKKSYPHVVEEIRGMAAGSLMEFHELFLKAMSTEILTYHHNFMKKKELAGCSDIMVNNSHCRALGHNEDWTIDVENKCFLVDVDLIKDTDSSANNMENSSSSDTNNSSPIDTDNISPDDLDLPARNERFIAFMFPGFLAGGTFYVNKHFAVSVNSLVPMDMNKGAVPLDILMRAMMGCETIDECVTVMKNEPVGCSYGINLNIASRTNNDMWSLEVYPEEGETVVDLECVEYSDDPRDKGTHYVHTNHYKHVDDVVESPKVKGSKAREETARKFPTPTCVQDICNILGDTSSSIEPIYREPGESYYSKNVATVASAIFDMKDSALHIYLENPRTTEKPFITLPFV